VVSYKILCSLKSIDWDPRSNTCLQTFQWPKLSNWQEALSWMEDMLITTLYHRTACNFYVDRWQLIVHLEATNCIFENDNMVHPLMGPAQIYIFIYRKEGPTITAREKINLPFWEVLNYFWLYLIRYKGGKGTKVLCRGWCHHLTMGSNVSRFLLLWLFFFFFLWILLSLASKNQCNQIGSTSYP